MHARLAVKSMALLFSGLMLWMVYWEYQSLPNSEQEIPVPFYEFHQPVNEDKYEGPTNQYITDPVIIWWTPLTGEPGQTKRCGINSCFFTINRAYRHHHRTKAFIFYGTDFTYGDLPLPRLTHHEWALLHEESPKNNYLLSHSEILEMFNHTATFRQESDLPLTLQYLESIQDLESKKYLVPTVDKNRALRQGKMALINYVQSDCGVPSDRDHFVKMLSKHIQVDSYGECEHNKDLPSHLRDPLESMGHEDFYNLLAQYKFTITFENAVCNDYVTEKFWRPFKVGSVPIVYGSPKIKELLPSEKSAILVNDYTDIESLVHHLKFLDENDEEYEKYLSYKYKGVKNDYLRNILLNREWGTINEYTKPSMIDTFECLICRRLHDNLQRTQEKKDPILYHASVEHYGCPKPKRFSDNPPGNLSLEDSNWWASEWIFSSYLAKALRFFLDGRQNFTGIDVERKAHSIHKYLKS